MAQVLRIEQPLEAPPLLTLNTILPMEFELQHNRDNYRDVFLRITIKLPMEEDADPEENDYALLYRVE